MEARERLARIAHAELAGGDPDGLIHHPAQNSWDPPTRRRWEQWEDLASAILSALHLTDAAALALMEGEGVVAPNYPAGDVIGPCLCGSWPGGKCFKCPMTDAHPYKENPDD